jgi:signal transduction histidine kinase
LTGATLRGAGRACQEGVNRFSLNSGLLAELSHDLRTPLNGILGFAALMHEGKLGPLSADQSECLRDILTSANEMLQLINEVSDLGKVESGTLELRPGPVDLTVVFDEVRTSLSSLSGQKQVQITRAVDPALRGIVADPARLKHLVASCATLAVKATPAGGRVVLRASAEGAARFRIEVEDTSERPKNLDEDGNLGLALSRRIAELQGGELGVRPTAGPGSIIYAVLPRTPEAP